MVNQGARGRWVGLGMAFFALSGCMGGSDQSATDGKATASLSGRSEQTVAIVAADEPRAALVAREVLARGGSVGDAAAALYFTLAATYPVAAGLGGGGVCLNRSADTRSVTSIDFLPRAARAGGGGLAVPGAVRGFAYIHARYGRLPWTEVISPAERYAALGHPMSRALASAVAANADAVRASPFLRALFVNKDGSIKGEGDDITQPGLAATLAQVRSRGPNGFYLGTFGGGLADSAAARTGTISRDDLADYRVEEAPAEGLAYAGRTIFAPASRTGAGALSVRVIPVMGEVLAENDQPADLNDVAQRVIAAALQSFGVGALPADFGSSGFLVADRAGNAIACGVTMARPFGTGVEAGALGFAFAPSPDKGAEGLAGAFLMPLMVSRGRGEGDVLFTGVGAGGRDAAAAVTTLAFVAAKGEGESIDQLLESAKRGPGNTVNALSCRRGLGGELRSCAVSADPDAHGMAARSVIEQPGGGGFLGIF